MYGVEGFVGFPQLAFISWFLLNSLVHKSNTEPKYHKMPDHTQLAVLMASESLTL